jgi:hypothetical protein
VAEVAVAFGDGGHPVTECRAYREVFLQTVIEAKPFDWKQHNLQTRRRDVVFLPRRVAARARPAIGR